MRIDLTNATLDELIEVMFDAGADAAARREAMDATDWLEFEVDPNRQILLLRELFQRSAALCERFSSAEIERGLWRLMGGEYSEDFTGHLWNPDLPLEGRVATVEAVYHLYDEVLARPPWEPIDFAHPDRLPRRFETIDYMVPDMLVHVPRIGKPESADRAAIRDAFLAMFDRLLYHPSPIAQYAALHGLGHLGHELGPEVVDHYMARHPDMPADQRAYAERAQRGEVL